MISNKKCYSYAILDPNVYNIGKIIRNSGDQVSSDIDFLKKLLSDSNDYEKIIKNYESDNNLNGLITLEFYEEIVEQLRATKCMVNAYFYSFSKDQLFIDFIKSINKEHLIHDTSKEFVCSYCK